MAGQHRTQLDHVQGSDAAAAAVAVAVGHVAADQVPVIGRLQKGERLLQQAVAVVVAVAGGDVVRFGPEEPRPGDCSGCFERRRRALLGHGTLRQKVMRRCLNVDVVVEHAGMGGVGVVRRHAGQQRGARITANALQEKLGENGH